MTRGPRRMFHNRDRRQVSLEDAFGQADFDKKAMLFDDAWPEAICIMASRKWPNILVNNLLHEVQSTFFRAELAEGVHDCVNTFLALFDEREFEDWLGRACSRLMVNDLKEDWFTEQKVNIELKDRFQVRIAAALTLPAAHPNPSDVRSLHVGFIISTV